MEGNDAAVQTAEVKTPGKIVSAGSPTKAVMNSAPVNLVEDAGGTELTNEQKPATAQAEAGTELTDEQKAAAAAANNLPELNDEQTNRIIAKALGIENFDGNIDAIKEKLKPATQALTDEQKAQADAAFEKRMLDHFLENKGTVEGFTALKQVAAADLTELSKQAITKELKDAGFDDNEISAVLVERYYQINPEELEIGDDETTAEFEKRKSDIVKKNAFGSKKLESRGSFIKKQAEDALGVLRESIKDMDLQKAEEASLSSKVDELATKLPRKLTFELGEANNQQIAPIQYDVSETDIADVVATLKDSEKRNQFLYNQDNSLNIDNIAQLMLKNKYLESALKVSYLEGGDRQVSEFEKTFPGRKAAEIGVGGVAQGSGGGRKGHIVARGAPQKAVARN